MQWREKMVQLRHEVIAYLISWFNWYFPKLYSFIFPNIYLYIYLKELQIQIFQSLFQMATMTQAGPVQIQNPWAYSVSPVSMQVPKNLSQLLPHPKWVQKCNSQNSNKCLGRITSLQWWCNMLYHRVKPIFPPRFSEFDHSVTFA